MTGVYVALGSNVRPHDNAARALAALRASFHGLRASRAYRNRAAGFEGEDFINLVVGFETNFALHELIAELRRIEALCGRGRNDPKWAPRAMDLDLLLFGSLVLQTPEVKLPRPDLLKRAYMLGPLADIAPALNHPTLHRTIGELWREFDQSAHPLEPVSLQST
jgi:2-amino-4-hydroxy-6-hydroxymethyldihydropteridine diphosphokinase